MPVKLFKLPEPRRDGRVGRGRGQPGPAPAPAPLRRLRHGQLRVHPGAGGLRVRGPRAERQRRQARQVSKSGARTSLNLLQIGPTSRVARLFFLYKNLKIWVYFAALMDLVWF